MELRRFMATKALATTATTTDASSSFIPDDDDSFFIPADDCSASFSAEERSIVGFHHIEPIYYLSEENHCHDEMEKEASDNDDAIILDDDDKHGQTQQSQPLHQCSLLDSGSSATPPPQRAEGVEQGTPERQAASCLAELDAIFGAPPSKKTTTSFQNDVFLFQPLQSNSRANSLPLPRKPSLKRISSSARLPRASVSFSVLQVREFDVALSDHPACSYGPPVGLGWKYRDCEAVGLADDCGDDEKVPSSADTYASHQSNTNTTSRSRTTSSNMILSYHARTYLLMQHAGCSPQDLQQAMSEVDRVKRERLVTDLLIPVEDTWERVTCSVQGLFGPRCCPGTNDYGDQGKTTQ
jgi:hypothetical protein